MVTSMAASRILSSTFRRDEFVDAIAARPSAGDGSASPLLAVALSALESNLWGGGVAILDGASGERLCGSQVAAGVSALAWTDDANDLLAFGSDNGDLQVVRLTKHEDAAAVLEPVVIPGEDTRPGHDDVVTGVAASVTDKNVFASCSWDLTVKLWDVTAMDKTLTTLEGHSDLIWDVAMSPLYAHTLATASQDATVQLWDDRDLVQKANSTLSTLGFAALAVDWHPTESHLLAVGLECGNVLTFDTRAPKSPLSELSAHESAIHRVKFAPHEPRLLAVGSDDASVSIIADSASPEARVQRLEPEACSSSSSAHSDYVRGLAWYAPGTGSTGAVLATGSWDHTLHSWKIDGGL